MWQKSGLYLKHHKYPLIGLCKEENHSNILEYFCKSHNVLCCAACINKIKGKGNGQHSYCTNIWHF